MMQFPDIEVPAQAICDAAPGKKSPISGKQETIQLSVSYLRYEALRRPSLELISLFICSGVFCYVLSRWSTVRLL